MILFKFQCTNAHFVNKIFDLRGIKVKNIVCVILEFLFIEHKRLLPVKDL